MRKRSGKKQLQSKYREIAEVNSLLIRVLYFEVLEIWSKLRLHSPIQDYVKHLPKIAAITNQSTTLLPQLIMLMEQEG